MNTTQRPATPPHVSLRNLRTATGLSLDQVGAAVADVLNLDEPINRGTISAIETGVRRASRQMLDALAIAYGLEPGALTTTYEPRNSRNIREAS